MDAVFTPVFFKSVWTLLLAGLGTSLFVAAIACGAATLIRRQQRLEAVRYGTACERDLRLHDYEVDQLGYATGGFWLGVAFAGLAVLGLLTSLLWLNLDEPLAGQSIPLIAIFSAFLCGGIAALFLLQAANTRKLFEVLHRDRKISEAIRLTDDLIDPQVRARAQIALALQLAGVGALDVAAMQVLARQAAERQQRAQRRGRRVYRVMTEPRGMARNVVR